MQSEQIKLNDWARVFFGNVPYSFYFEVAIHVLIVYALLMICMRLLGTRMSAQLSRLDLATMVALASAIGVPILSPTNGLLPTVIIAIIVVSISRFIAKRSYKSQYIEQLTQGDVDVLVEESVMQPKIMKKTRISRERLFAQLRSSKMSHLGMVKRLYLEAGGDFSIIENENAQPGLMTLPEWDTDFIQEKLKETETVVCKNCGQKKPEAASNGSIKCTNCGESDWTKAVTEK